VEDVLQFGDGARIRLRRYLDLRCGTLTLEASLLMWELCRSAPSALRVSFASTSIQAVLALRART
jgi:hypothetical protein